jgi:hypothetical protein
VTEDIFYRNQPASKDKAAVFASAKRCIYCLDAEPPFTREHVMPRGMGGGMILLEASCSDCQKIINEIETYCMRGPFLSSSDVPRRSRASERSGASLLGRNDPRFRAYGCRRPAQGTVRHGLG